MDGKVELFDLVRSKKCLSQGVVVRIGETGTITTLYKMFPCCYITYASESQVEVLEKNYIEVFDLR